MIIIDSRKEHNMYENIKICAAAAIIFSPAVFDVFLCYQKLQIRKKKIDLKIKEIENENQSKVLLLTDKKRFSKLHPQIFNSNFTLSLEFFFERMYENKNIDLILHMLGGYDSDIRIIIKILLEHKLYNKINTYIPYYSLSGGTIYSLYGDTINMMSYSLLSPFDAQIEILDKDKNENVTRPVKFLANRDIIKEKEILSSDDDTISALSILKKYNMNKIKSNFIDKHGHYYFFTSKDLDSFGIKNSKSISKKMYELMDLLYENDYHYNLAKKLQESIKNIEEKRKSKIIVVKNIIDLIMFLNNSKINDISYNKLEIIYMITTIEDAFAVAKILNSYKGDVTIYAISDKIILDKHFLLLLLSNKKVCMCDFHVFLNKYPNFVRLTDNIWTSVDIYRDEYNQIKNDVTHLLNNNKYDRNDKWRLIKILESTEPFFGDNIEKINISNLDKIKDNDIINILEKMEENSKFEFPESILDI